MGFQESINDKKRARIKQLLVSARKNEPLFIVRLLQVGPDHKLGRHKFGSRDMAWQR